MQDATVVEVETPQGPARAHVRAPDGARAGLALGHGAGGGVGARDLVVTTEEALALGVAVALIEQPYRVAGRRAPPRAPRLDEAWIAIVGHLSAAQLAGLPLVTGGRSSGARVACRTAARTGAVGVLCLAFPLQPPARSGAPPRPSRLPELEAVPVPVLVVQGERDPFGMPPEASRRTVAHIPGDHSLKSDTGALRDAVRAWLGGLLG